MSGDEYNGWPNRETWAVHMWATNTEGLYLWMLRMAADAERRPGVLADMLEEHFMGYWAHITGTPSPGDRDVWLMFQDMNPLYRVDWFRLAEAFIGDLDDWPEIADVD